ncbi:S-layer homology domain-containing protein [Leptolyngbya sp. CCNP1308]|uniref:S-layer homology domain-containing protein n=1 Tax=Leptolyngbya sp. CCNP1308 TaxID=3110255 RepID=UPI002B1F8C64|nr:S-layer homology domain-containing protein [Leptolyngbya sp. CCNP1308]MEA5450992.1 S-layer homology domain-containing protein [Leptolyngbya sp. CCNP1308]
MSAALRLTTLMVSGLSLLFVAGCAGSSLEQSLEADPQLQDRPVFTGEDPETPAEAEAEPDPAEPPAAESDPTEASDLPEPETSPEGSATTLLNEVPEDLRPYVQNWLALGIVEPANSQTANGNAPSPDFQPNQPITRGEFAQWLLTANNAFYKDVPAKRMRPATAGTTPAFQDVPASHPYFAAIQGLAEAGIIPSAKTGNATAVTFRPDAPLTRETLVLWKVPLDLRAPLPTASAEAVTTAWGFQDTAQVEPLALRAVLADHQNGDFANIRRAFGYTTLFQPQKGVTQAEAAAALWRFGNQTEGISAKDLLGRSSTESGSSTPTDSTNSL